MILRILPTWSPFIAMAIWPFILVKKGRKLSERTLRHERIHHQQQKEMLVIFFYAWYLLEWLIRMFQHRFRWMEAYKDISFELEAFGWESVTDYVEKRKPYAWWRHV